MAQALPNEVSRILEKYEEEFFKVVNAKHNLLRLKRRRVIDGDLIAKIESTNDETPREILFEHLKSNANVVTLREYCKMIIAAEAFPKMQKLGMDMLRELPPEEAPESGDSSYIGIEHPLQVQRGRNPSAVQSKQCQKAEMDGKADVHSKPARTYTSAPEPCVQDDEQLQMNIVIDIKGTARTQVAVHGVDATCVPMASKEITQLNSRATSVVKVLGTPSPSETPDSQTDFSAQGQRHTIPKVSLSSSKRLALQVKDQSECIQTGHLSIYKLKLLLVTEDKENGVAKYRFGKPRPDTQEYVVMLVGATGAGKSTLINGMVNYILGVDWEDDFRFKLIADEGGISQAHSLTTTITAYTIPHQQGSPFDGTLTIVDTPGFGDTTGLDSDKRIVEQIRTFFSIPGKKGIDHIHGIGFVTQAALARLTPTQRYVFASILAVFGKDIGKNILMMTTFADGKTPPVLEAVDEAGIGYCKSFKFNNSALYTDQAAGGQEDEVVSSFDKMFWDMGMESFKPFFKQLACMEARSLQLTKEVLEERKRLEVIMQSLPLQIQAISKLQCHWSSHVNNPFWFEAQEVTVEKTYDELKKRYEAALSGKSRQENIVSMIRAEIATSYHEVFLMIRQAQQILQRLDEIALHPNPLSEIEYIDLLIHAEEMDGGPGAAQRIKCLKTVREKAELMSTVKDDKIFEHKALKQAEQLAKAEAEKVGWFKKTAPSTWNAIAEKIAEHFK